jgi:hypothetical protein
MGNNHLSGELPETLGNLRNLQRIVLHQNNLRGPVPPALGELGCIVNLAGNPLLHHGEDVPSGERKALVELFQVRFISVPLYISLSACLTDCLPLFVSMSNSSNSSSHSSCTPGHPGG